MEREESSSAPALLRVARNVKIDRKERELLRPISWMVEEELVQNSARHGDFVVARNGPDALIYLAPSSDKMLSQPLSHSA